MIKFNFYDFHGDLVASLSPDYIIAIRRKGSRLVLITKDGDLLFDYMETQTI